MDEEKKEFLVRIIRKKMWKASIVMAAMIFSALLFYVHVYYGALSLLAVSNAVAATAAIMIGSSFAMSGIAYYYDFLDKKISYRKYIGLAGFWLALVYSIMLLYVNPTRYLYGFFDNFGSADVLLGLGAMVILTFTALISNDWAMNKLGGKNWRKGLRLGYLAYAMLVIRAYVLEKQIWLEWLESLDGLPPPRLIISAFTVGVLALRVSMIISKHFRKKAAVTAS